MISAGEVAMGQLGYRDGASVASVRSVGWAAFAWPEKVCQASASFAEA